ncbi:hypothetical protein ACFL6Q_06255 [Candidatus Neomarinimicrobiota bacterium]
MTINDEIALAMAADLTFGSLPKTTNSPADLAFYPALYQPVGKERHLLPLVGLQYWVSPNLSLLGGIGGGIAGGNVVQFSRIGLRYFPATLPLGSFMPEIFITQNRIEGLSLLIDQFLRDSLGNEIEDSENYETRYDSKWNEFGWGYQGQISKYSLSVAIILVYQRTFTGNTGKLTGKTQLLSFTLGRDIFKKVQLSIHARIGPLASMGLSEPIHGGGIQLSLPI